MVHSVGILVSRLINEILDVARPIVVERRIGSVYPLGDGHSIDLAVGAGPNQSNLPARAGFSR